MNYYLQAFRQYADFSGRASKTEFWMFFLFNFLSVFVLYLLAIIAVVAQSPGLLYFFTGILLLYAFGVFVPNLAITVRRLHDAGESGWMILISLIPIIGAIWLIVLLCKDSVTNEIYQNNYAYNETNTEQKTTAANSNLCPFCNSPIDTETVFCENCGKKVN